MMRKLLIIPFLIVILGMTLGCEKKPLEISNITPQNSSITIGDVNSLDFYHDFDENIIIPSDEFGISFLIDINGDSINDFKFSYSPGEVGNFYGSNEINIDQLVPNFSFFGPAGIEPVDMNDIVDCHGTFNNYCFDEGPLQLKYSFYSSYPYQVNDSTWEFIDTSYTNGGWYENDYKYMAFKFNEDDQQFLGWINVSFNENGKLEIDDYGYKSVDGCP